MSKVAFVVVREGVFSGRTYLRLDGPFEYPRWMTYPREATALSAARAAQYASIYGGVFCPAAFAVDVSIAAPETVRTGSPKAPDPFQHQPSSDLADYPDIGSF